ncbi:hypothetical protein LTR65_001047 [Meristemomyces frigidus]
MAIGGLEARSGVIKITRYIVRPMALGQSDAPQSSSQTQQPGAGRLPNIAGLSLINAASTADPQGSRMNVIDSYNQHNGVHSIVQTGPAEQITDPTFLQAGIRAHKKLFGNDPDTEHLYPSFKKRKQPKNFFACGRAFMVLWSEPAGEPNKTVITSKVQSDVTAGKFGERVFSKVRRFIVIRESELYCSALSIASYGGQGVSKNNMIKAEHGIVYIGKVAPSAQLEELARRGESGMQPVAIRIDPDDPTQKLQEMSRINYGKVYTIEHNVKVHSVGTVNRESWPSLIYQFQQVWATSIGTPRGMPPLREGVVESFDLSRSSGQTAFATQVASLMKKGYSQAEAIEVLKKKLEELAKEAKTKEGSERGDGSSEEDEIESDEHETQAGPSQNQRDEAATRAWQKRGLSRVQALAKVQATRKQETVLKATPNAAQKAKADYAEKKDKDDEDESDDEAEEYDPVMQARVQAAVKVLRQKGMSRADAMRAVKAGIAKQRAAAIARKGQGKGKAPEHSRSEEEEEEDDNDDEEAEESDRSGESDE